MSQAVRRSLAAALLAASVGAASALPARADTVVLQGGKKLEGVTVSRNDDVVVVNPWKSRCPDMTWEIPEKNRYPRDKVVEVVIEDAPLVEGRRRSVRQDLDAAGRRELAAFFDQHKLKDEAERERRLARAAEARAQAAEGADPPPPADAKGDPELDPVLVRLEREYLKLKDPAALEAQWKQMAERGTTRTRTFLERARRSAAQPTGRRE